MDPLCTQNESDLAPRLFRVTRRRRELHDTVTLELETGEESPLSFCAGQFNMLYVFGIGEVPISISGSPHEPHPLMHTIRSAGAVTKAICSLKRGQTLGVRGPFGKGWPLEAAIGHDLVFIAGGIGLAPLRPAVRQVIAQRDRYGKVSLLVGARTPKDLLYSEELKEWRSRFDLQVLITVDSAGADWRSHVGVVTMLIPRAEFEAGETVAMICGPEVMMRFCVTELRKRGVVAENTYVSLERNMKCAVGYCGHCQFGPTFVCKDGPVFPLARIEPFFRLREV
jgi:NAD(P)H-flavin reductase